MGNCCALPQPPTRMEAPPPQRYSIVQQPRPTWVGLDVGDEGEDEDEQRQDLSDEEDTRGRLGHETRRLLSSECHDVEPVGCPSRSGDRWSNGVKYTGVNGGLTSTPSDRSGGDSGGEDSKEECEAWENCKSIRSGKKGNYHAGDLSSEIQSHRKGDISSKKQDAAVECGDHKLESTGNCRNRVSKTSATAVSAATHRTPDRHSVTSDAKRGRATAQRRDRETFSSSVDRQRRKRPQSSLGAAGYDSVDGPPMRKRSPEDIERSEDVTDKSVYRNPKIGFEVVAECFPPTGRQESKTNETCSLRGDVSRRSVPRELSRSRDDTLVKKGYSRLDDGDMQGSKPMERKDKAASASTLSECSSGRVSRNTDVSDQVTLHGNVSLFPANNQNGPGFASDENCSGVSTSRQEASVKPKVKSRSDGRRQTTEGNTDKNSPRFTGMKGISCHGKPSEQAALVPVPSDCDARGNASNNKLARQDLDRSSSSLSGTLKFSTSNGGIKNRVSTPCDSEPSFLLRNDLEIKESIRRKDLKELVESFRNNTSLMRKPCKEFLDGQLFQEAQIEHHNTLLSTIRAMNACSLSCVNSRASSMRTVNEQSTIDIGDFATPGETFHGRNARKGLNFDSMAATLPCKKKRSMVSSSPKLSEGPINLGSLKSVELFNLDDFLLEDTNRSLADTDRASSMPRQRRSRKPSSQSFLPSDDCSSTERASATKDGYRGQRSSLLSEVPSSGRASPRRSGLSVRAPLGASSEIEVDSSAWLHQDEPVEEGEGSPSQQDRANKSKGSVSSPDKAKRSLSALHKPTSSFLGGDEDDYSNPVDSSFPSKNGSHNNDDDDYEGAEAQSTNGSTCRTPSKSRSRYHRGASNSHSSFVDNFATQEDTTSPSQNNRSHSTPKKRTNKYSHFNNSSLNDDNVSVFNADLDVSKRSDESSKYKPMGGSTSAFSNKNEVKMDHFDDDDIADVSQENGYQNDGDFDPSNAHRKKSRSAFSRKKPDGLSNGNGSHNSFTGSLDYDNEFPPLGGGSDESSRVNGSSRLNNSPSSGGDDSSTTFDGHFAALNGNSPKFTKKNFKFDEDPRFDSNSSSGSFRRASTSNDLDDSSSVLLRHRSTRSNGTPPSGGRRRSRRDVVNDSQEVQPESLFELSNEGDLLVDEAFVSPPNGDSIPHGEEENEKEGPSLQLSRHVRISKKGVSVGALGCELTIGPRVQLNLFSKKTATLV